jgi:hypothetical protein
MATVVRATAARVIAVQAIAAQWIRGDPERRADRARAANCAICNSKSRNCGEPSRKCVANFVAVVMNVAKVLEGEARVVPVASAVSLVIPALRDDPVSVRLRDDLVVRTHRCRNDRSTRIDDPARESDAATGFERRVTTTSSRERGRRVIGPGLLSESPHAGCRRVLGYDHSTGFPSETGVRRRLVGVIGFGVDTQSDETPGQGDNHGTLEWIKGGHSIVPLTYAAVAQSQLSSLIGFVHRFASSNSQPGDQCGVTVAFSVSERRRSFD